VVPRVEREALAGNSGATEGGEEDAAPSVPAEVVIRNPGPEIRKTGPETRNPTHEAERPLPTGQGGGG